MPVFQFDPYHRASGNLILNFLIKDKNLLLSPIPITEQEETLFQKYSRDWNTSLGLIPITEHVEDLY